MYQDSPVKPTISDSVVNWNIGRGIFSLDARSLAVFRIVLALILLFDMYFRFPDRIGFYSSAGVIADFSPAFLGTWLGPSLPWWTWLGASLAALALLIGCLTRWATLICWLFTLLVRARNPAIVEQGDVLLSLLLFWGLFLPLGAYASVDARRKKISDGAVSLVFSWASVALFLQIFLMYSFGVAQKLLNSADWWQEGNAIFYALSFEPLTTALATPLLQHPDLLRLMSRIVLLLELLLPCALFFPIRSGKTRSIAILILAGLHLSFRCFFLLWPFPWVNLAALTALLPSWFWERLHLPRGRAKPFNNSTAYLIPLIGLVVLINLASLPGLGAWLPASMERTARGVSLYQNWHMFSPAIREVREIQIEGKRKDDSKVDLAREKSFQFLGRLRWRLYLAHLGYELDAESYYRFSKFLCRVQQDSPTTVSPFQTVSIFYEKQLISPDRIPEPKQSFLVYRHSCE